MFLNYPIKTEYRSVFPRFLLVRPSKVAKSANCNFILANCFIETKKLIRDFFRHYKMNAVNVSSGGTTHDSAPR